VEQKDTETIKHKSENVLCPTVTPQYAKMIRPPPPPPLSSSLFSFSPYLFPYLLSPNPPLQHVQLVTSTHNRLIPTSDLFAPSWVVIFQRPLLWRPINTLPNKRHLVLKVESGKKSLNHVLIFPRTVFCG